MKKIILLLSLLILGTTLFSAIYPTDSAIGQIVSGKDSVVEELFLQSAKEEYSLSWLEKYVDSSVISVFNISYQEVLSSILPLKNPIISKLSNNRIYIKDLNLKKIISYALSEDNLIIALSIEDYQ